RAGLIQGQLEGKVAVKVEISTDGESCLRILAEQDFDIVLISNCGSGLSGLQLLHLIRTDGIDLPIIIIGTAANADAAGEALQAGAFGYLEGGCGEPDAEKLHAVVRAALQDRESRIRNKMLLIKQHLAERVFDVSKEGVVVSDARNRIEAINPAFTAITGYDIEEVAGRNLRILNSGRHDEVFYQQMWDSINTTGSWEGEVWNRRKSGEVYPESLVINEIYDDDQVTHYIGVFTDISGRKKDEENIWHQANYDALTDLPNRTLL
ncbi:MAG: PAS domain S-box protein, partial [Mariprofundaceae bacterium]|nr:PAS domain S-box protein [Mariprofundaceae bacterium]